MITYKKVLKQLKDNSESTFKNGIYGTYTGHTLLTVFLVILISSFVVSKTPIPNINFFVIYWLTIIIGLINILTRKCSFGMTSTGFIFIRYSHLGHRIEEIIDFKNSKIKYLDYKRLFNINYVVIIYENNRKKESKLKLLYLTKRFGFKDHKNHANAISKKLIELQKVLDKGDY